MTTLQDELGVMPSAATADLYQQLLTAEETSPEPESVQSSTSSLPMPVPLVQSSDPLIGRDPLLQQLDQWLLAESASSTPLLLLTGEPGIGKTRLLEALVERAAHRRFHHGWGCAFAAEQLRSYGIWIDLLRSASVPNRSSEFEALSVYLRDSLQESFRDRGQLLDAVVQGLAAVATPQAPLLLLLDDIHWLDEASTTLLHYVFRLLGSRSVWIACAARDQELQDNPAVLNLVQSLQRANRLQKIEVPPLSAEAILALVQPSQRDDSVPSLDAQQIYVDSGGNPLFALEVARAATQRTHSLSDLIGDRLQRLDQGTRDLLPWAAALGQRFDPEILALAAGYSPMQFLAAMEQLELQHVVYPACSGSSTIDGANHYNFVHDLVRQVAYDQLSLPRRRLIHGQLAKTLDTQMVEGDLATQVAYHAELAGNHALAAQSYATAAARSLRLFAYRDVIQLVTQGLHHCESLPNRDRLLWSAQLWQSRVMAGVAPVEVTAVETQLKQLLSDTVGLSMPEAELAVQEALAVLNYEQDNLTAVHEHVLNALETLPPSPRLQAESLAANGSCLAEIERDMGKAEAILLEAQSLADRLGLMLIDVPAGLGRVECYRGDYERARAYLRRAYQLAQNQQSLMRQGHILSYLVMTGWDHHQPKITEAEALLHLSAQLPQGSEASFAQALIAVHTYADDPNATDALDQMLDQLEQLDAQRRLAFVASHACEVAISHNQREIAQHYAAIAYQAARRVGHPNDMVISAALQLLCTDLDSVNEQMLKNITVDCGQLSARAQSLRKQARQRVHQLESCSSQRPV